MGDSYDPAAYGRVWAEDYDSRFEDRDDPAVVAAFVSGLAPGGRVLELGIGTGRLAIGLLDAGLWVTGVDSSPVMLKQFLARPGAERASVLEGDFVTVDAGGPFDVALLAFSTLFLLPTQESQLRCLANVRRQLRPGGSLVVEAFVPDPSWWVRGQDVAVGRLDDDAVTLKLAVHDPVRQVISTQEIGVVAGATSLRPNRLRYVWPAEMDAMALASGLRLRGRWSDWQRQPFTAASTMHVSVFDRVG